MSLRSIATFLPSFIFCLCQRVDDNRQPCSNDFLFYANGVHPKFIQVELSTRCDYRTVFPPSFKAAAGGGSFRCERIYKLQVTRQAANFLDWYIHDISCMCNVTTYMYIRIYFVHCTALGMYTVHLYFIEWTTYFIVQRRPHCLKVQRRLSTQYCTSAQITGM